MSRNEPNPAFLVYAADEIADSASMTLKQLGMFTRLRAHAWREHGLPNDHAEIARRLGVAPKAFAKHSAVVLESFREQDGRLVLPAQEEQRARQLEKREKAQASANARWKGDANALRTHKPEGKGSDANALRTECSAVVVADAVAVVGADASKSESGSGPRTIRGLSAELVRFVDRFYASASEARRAWVAAELRSALDPAGPGARIAGDTYAKARDLAHLEGCCRAVIRNPPDKADAAIVIVLKKLLNSIVDDRGRTVTEAASANARAEETVLNAWETEASTAVARWTREHPDEFRSIQKLAERVAASERMSSTEPGYDVALRGIVAKMAREAAGFPEFDDWQSARKNGRIQQLEGVTKNFSEGRSAI